MRNQPDTSSKNKQSVEYTHVEVILGLFRAECATVAHKIYEANGNAAVNVEDEVVLFRSGDSLDRNCIVEHFRAWEALVNEFLHKFDS